MKCELDFCNNKVYKPLHPFLCPKHENEQLTPDEIKKELEKNDS